MVLGNCATQFFSTAILGMAKLTSMNLLVYDVDYNQIEMQLVDSLSDVYKFHPDAILLYLSTDKLYEEFLDLPMKLRNKFADDYIEKIKAYWDLIEKYSNARILQMNFTEIDDKILGQYSAKKDVTFVYQTRKLNWLLEEAMQETEMVYPIDLLSVQIQMGQRVFYDATFYYNAKMGLSTKALPYVAKAVVDVLKSMLGRIKKCVVLDLDNTLWGGIIGDDGINNIEIGDLGRGHVFINFQRWLKQLKDCGIILAVCSKNDECTAKEPFEQRKEMVLKLKDISLFVANWNDKVSNIKMIQETLNIGMDSIVFIDDNPFERDLVRKMIPDVEVPEMPNDPAHYLEYLQECNYFDTVSFTEETTDRTKQYKAEFERKKLQAEFVSLDEYLINLEMKGVVTNFEESQFSRIAQLTQRSNQFNLRTIRYTEDQIRKVASNDHYITLSYTLHDKLGDYGLVGVIIAEERSEKEVFIDTWLMSCRVLKRGMEAFMINNLIDFVAKKGYSCVSAEYIPSQKNGMVKDLYKTMGFIEYLDNQYRLEVSKYQNRQTYIEEGN